MDEKPTDSLMENTETSKDVEQATNSKAFDSDNQYNLTPAYMEPVEQEADQSQKQLSKRKLSWTGLIIGLCIIAFSISQFVLANTCTSEFCGLGYGMMALMSTGVSLIFLIPSIAAFVTSSKSYRNTTKRSISGIVFGTAITVLSILVLAYPAAVIGRTLTDGSTWFNFLKVSMIFIGPLAIAGLIGTYIGLNITYKALRVNKRKIFTYISLVIVLIGIVSYGIFSYYSYKTEQEERFRPTNSAKITGNYSWKTVTLDDGSIQELVVKFDVLPKKDVIVTALLSIDGGLVGRKDSIPLKDNKSTTITFNIPIQEITDTRNRGDKILTDGKFNVTSITLKEDGGDYKTVDEKTNVISGKLDPQKIESNDLTINLDHGWLVGTARSRLHKIKLVQITYDDGKSYIDTKIRFGSWDTYSLEWWSDYKQVAGDYTVTARMLDQNGNEIALPPFAKNVTWINVPK